MSKVAFCFLLYDKVEHRNLWKDFFRNSPEGEYSIYTHPKKISSESNDWIKKHKIKNRIKTGWCEENLVFAFIRMLRHAIKDPENKYFCLLSGSCIPLHDFKTIKRRLFKFPHSRINFSKNKTVFDGDLPENKMNPHSQFMVLNRRQAIDCVRLLDKNDEKAQNFLKFIRKLFKRHRNAWTWLTSCEDETYFTSYFEYLYGPRGSSRFNSQIKNSKSTYVHFASWDNDHPVIWSRAKLKKDNDKLLKSMRRQSLFGRKYTKDAVKYICQKTKVLDCTK
tara:strand:+ start:411 stop:1244 length:834 start_codon:yes stop_codon:yes gene_type:complete